jgi:hypothetical protein
MTREVVEEEMVVLHSLVPVKSNWIHGQSMPRRMEEML